MINFEFQGNRKLRDEITSSRLNAILTELRRIRPVAGRGINVQAEGNGSRISVLDAALSGIAEPANRHPFQISSEEDPANKGGYLVSVRPGTLNGVLATNWNTKEGVGADELKYVVLTASATSNSIVSTELSLDDQYPSSEQSPVKWALPDSFAVLLGMVRGRTVWQVVYDNLSYSASKRITTDRANPQVGQLPYENWYIWQAQ
jgi:hypothetical protein